MPRLSMLRMVNSAFFIQRKLFIYGILLRHPLAEDCSSTWQNFTSLASRHIASILDIWPVRSNFSSVGLNEEFSCLAMLSAAKQKPEAFRLRVVHPLKDRLRKSMRRAERARGLYTHVVHLVGDGRLVGAEHMRFFQCCVDCRSRAAEVRRDVRFSRRIGHGSVGFQRI